ncbi:MAG: permease [Planctomycetes bacterium]|nr:permease [Planctomycetota bacterium]
MNPTLLLLIATLALAVGPLLDRLGRRFPIGAALIDGGTVGAIVAVAALHLMPEAGAHIGWWALALFFVGLSLPRITERLGEQSWQGWRVLIGVVIALLFVVHLLVEGAALASTANDERLALATLFAVASHNLPVGAVLWGHTKRRFGPLWSAAALVVVGAITWFGPVVIPVSEGLFTGICSALLAGGLVHLVIEHSTPEHRALGERAYNAWSGIGALAAVGLVLVHNALTHDHGAHEHGQGDLPGQFFELCLETAPALLLGVIAAGLIEAFLPDATVRFLSRGSRFRQALAGVAIGTPMPVCSCGVLPIYRSLIQKGVPASAALALLVAAPEIGVDSLLLSWNQLGLEATLARLACALLLALAIGWFVGRLAEPTARAVSAPAAPALAAPRTRPSPWRAIERGLFETWGHLAPWILVGLYATVLFEPWISTDWAASMPKPVQIIVLTLIGMPTYICAAAATPFAALLLVKGFSAGAVIAFLLVGPATNVTTIGALARQHSRRVAIAFVATALVVTFVLALAADACLGELAAALPVEEAEHEHGGLHLAAGWFLIALSAWLVLRVGPRAFLGQLAVQGHDDHGAHGHAHASGEGCDTHAACATTPAASRPHANQHAHGHGHGHADPGAGSSPDAQPRSDDARGRHDHGPHGHDPHGPH